MRWLLLLSLALPCASARAEPDFWKHWGDGRAEVSSYALTQPRYGQARGGTAVLIFVTEDFSDSARVKADPGTHTKADVYPVLKLNTIKSFQTGVYPYHVMTSVFVRAPEAGVIVRNDSLRKLTFSAQEWCGQVFVEWLPKGESLAGQLHSYFDGEGDRVITLPWPAGAVAEEELPLLVRGLIAAPMAAGAGRTFQLFVSTERNRFLHREPRLVPAVLHRSKKPTSIVSAIGRVDVDEVTLDADGIKTTWQVEVAYPHRLIAWTSSTGEAATIKASVRMEYWKLNRLGDEPQLELLGLQPVPVR